MKIKTFEIQNNLMPAFIQGRVLKQKRKSKIKNAKCRNEKETFYEMKGWKKSC